mmetsp:Transcript_3156/g.11445  ORF Transcript_3156/g.11445 Transcript_3156/m.11445 type:complete len:236 (-) Transcript_3156:609-1316(-)
MSRWASTAGPVTPSPSPPATMAAPGSTLTTSFSSAPKCFLRALSIPMDMVAVAEGQVPQAPSSSSFTTPASTLTTLTLPPSAIRYGRTSSSTEFTPSTSNATEPAPAPAPAAPSLAFAAPSASKGLTLGPLLSPLGASSLVDLVCLSMTSLQSSPSTALIVFSLRCLLVSSSLASPSCKLSPIAFLILSFCSSCAASSASVRLTDPTEPTLTPSSPFRPSAPASSSTHASLWASM